MSALEATSATFGPSAPLLDALEKNLAVDGLDVQRSVVRLLQFLNAPLREKLPSLVLRHVNHRQLALISYQAFSKVKSIPTKAVFENLEHLHQDRRGPSVSLLDEKTYFIVLSGFDPNLAES
ncbi:hypothetical protein FIBSPDRAFT_1043097 [Athelia psychrophila]|uniref:Uncharacterized protein n=1 Tax=Athelia psychrophila TaxID=1759441 RepID=A0A166LNV8_9AGAM|nr:hypothetical protein FIBSPDRAFT_1043097 [Fibularhizoctonia sp. CBS 109695]